MNGTTTMRTHPDWLEPVREAFTPSEMRTELVRLRRNSPIVQKVMDSADYTGLSSEDRYTMLAYYAMKALVQAQQQVYDYVVTTPSGAFLTTQPPAPPQPTIFFSENISHAQFMAQFEEGDQA
jgi:hypothetical protein